MRIATWNLDRPWKNGKTRRAAAQLARIQEVNADIWILTETYSGFELPGCLSVASPSSDGVYDGSESAVAIWVRQDWPIKLLSATNHSVVAEVLAPMIATPLVVYGSIIPWRDARPGTAWERHLAEAARQTHQWQEVRESMPSHALIVGGDFNMTLHADTGYGTKDGRQVIRAGFDAARLSCPTAVDIRGPDFGLTRDNIDHIAVDWSLKCAVKPIVWAGETRQEGKLSDHNGVAVDVQPRT